MKPVKKINWEDYRNPMVNGGLDIIKKINSRGYEAYLVGGAVRDIVMGQKMSDFDIATNMPMDELKKSFKTHDLKKSEDFGVVVVVKDGEEYEIAQFREEKGYTDKRRPDEVKFVSSIDADIKRRDFTFGAMFIDAEGNLFDPEGGLKDIEKKKIRTVGKAEERFDEDMVRMLRAISFAVRLGFDIEPDIENAIGKLKHQLVNEPTDRFRKEIKDKIMAKGGDKFKKAMDLFIKYGIFEIMFPEIKVTTSKLNAIDKAQSDSMVVNFSILMHDMDLDKVDQFGNKNKMTNKEIDAIKYIVVNLNNYGNLGTINKELALKVILNSNFSDLRKVFIALNGSDISNSKEIINKINAFSNILSRQKEINKLIIDKGIEGKQFGDIVKSVKSWLFEEFSKGNTPSNSEINNYIENIIKD